jgi:16S rRNA (guanine966-N2)-methyltransferase
MPRNNRTETPRPVRFADATNGPTAGPPTRRATPASGGRSEVRIIGGEWRGRKLHFPEVAGLRPTPDRVRETVFNWLQFDLAGRRCLDLFAGSGAFGFESLSRGATEVVFVERDAAAADAIRRMLGTLQCDRGQVAHADAREWLRRGPARPFDVVFVDPPYAERWLVAVAEQLELGGWLAPAASIYLEDAAVHDAPALPAGWHMHRSKRAGDVGYHLARRGAAARTPDQ